MGWLSTTLIITEILLAFITLVLFFWVWNSIPKGNAARSLLGAAAGLYGAAVLTMVLAVGFDYAGKSRTVVFWLAIASVVFTIIALIISFYAYSRARAAAPAIVTGEQLIAFDAWLAANVLGISALLVGVVEIFVARRTPDAKDTVSTPLVATTTAPRVDLIAQHRTMASEMGANIGEQVAQSIQQQMSPALQTIQRNASSLLAALNEEPTG